ncbi:hypothetical protein JW897_15800 [Chromobacterium alkanivorans]|uniref:hypothetical protein n=1 Tax=Chromobacterium alkanivorans TaxID=1071719 RepID=UPI00196876D4|nr:hypothetical protein [Chromobacterium alkanivorans]MBN3005204.1 hypothetical protein [Chromobacterium alkanivorans]
MSASPFFPAACSCGAGALPGERQAKPSLISPLSSRPERIVDALGRPACIIKKIQYVIGIYFDANILMITATPDVSPPDAILIFVLFNKKFAGIGSIN